MSDASIRRRLAPKLRRLEEAFGKVATKIENSTDRFTSTQLVELELYTAHFLDRLRSAQEAVRVVKRAVKREDDDPEAA